LTPETGNPKPPPSTPQARPLNRILILNFPETRTRKPETVAFNAAGEAFDFQILIFRKPEKTVLAF